MGVRLDNLYKIRGRVARKHSSKTEGLRLTSSGLISKLLHYYFSCVSAVPVPYKQQLTGVACAKTNLYEMVTGAPKSSVETALPGRSPNTVYGNYFAPGRSLPRGHAVLPIWTIALPGRRSSMHPPTPCRAAYT